MNAPEGGDSSAHRPGRVRLGLWGRRNGAHPAKHDAFVLDFANDVDTIEAAFSDYYQTTILSQETDPDKLHDLRADLYAAGVFEEHHVRAVVDVFLAGGDRTQLDPPLDACVATYKEELDEDEQVAFKGNAKAFVRDLQLPRLDPALLQPGLGGALDLSATS